jgi:ABC-type glycerol-3-phosphate transport system permease component
MVRTAINAYNRIVMRASFVAIPDRIEESAEMEDATTSGCCTT